MNVSHLSLVSGDACSTWNQVELSLELQRNRLVTSVTNQSFADQFLVLCNVWVVDVQKSSGL